MKPEKPIMFDRDVAEMLGITVRTLQRRVLRPVAGEINLNAAEPVMIGSRRLWLRENIEKLLGIKRGMTR